MKGTAMDILVKHLEQEGVEYIFGVPGAHLLPLYDAIYKNGTVKAVLSRHEAGAAFMAYGYAITTGKPGVCCGTVGPGATNLITGVASAYADSIPLLVLTVQVGTTSVGRGALQEGTGIGRTINQVGLFQNISKRSTMELRGANVPFTVQTALRVAMSGRPGPVHIDLPADVQKESIDADIPPVTAYRPSPPQGIDPSLVNAMATALLEAEKPAILLGHGFASGRLGVDIVELAERLQAPVATTLRGKGAFPEDHRLALGCVGLYGTRAANSYFRSGVDVLLSLGSSFHEFTSHVWDPAFQPTRALLQVDLDPAEIGKNYLVTHAITADAQTAAAALLVATAGKKRTGADIAEFKRKHKYLQEAVMTSDAVPIKPQRLMREISHVLPRNAVVLADIGNTVTWAERYLPCYPEGRFVTLSGLAAMGSATAAAVGCKLGRPGDPVVCLCGDGDFQMTGMEVATAVSHNIPVVWIILKNESLGMIHDVQGANYQSRYIATDLGTTDFVMLARALGAQAYRANSAPGVNEALSHALDGNGPAVIEVTIDEKEAPPMKPRMLALQRSMGLQKPVQALSWQAVKALFQMVKEK